MARLTAPLMSLDASGSVAGALTFAKWKGRNYVRQLVQPANPRSATQVSVRAMMAFLSQAWGQMTDPQKASWATLADAGNYSTFNAYVRENQRRWTQQSYPINQPSQSALTPPTLGVLTATGGVGIIDVSQAITSADDMWGVVFTASLSTGYTPGRSNTRLIRYGTTTPVAGTMLNVPAGEWFVRAAGITPDGQVTVFVAEQSATVT